MINPTPKKEISSKMGYVRNCALPKRWDISETYPPEKLRKPNLYIKSDVQRL